MAWISKSLVFQQCLEKRTLQIQNSFVIKITTVHSSRICAPFLTFSDPIPCFFKPLCPGITLRQNLYPPPLKKELRYVHLRTSYEKVWLTSFLVLWLPRHCQRTASTAPALIGPYWHGWLTPSVAQTVSSRSTVSAARCRALPTAEKN